MEKRGRSEAREGRKRRSCSKEMKSFKTIKKDHRSRSSRRRRRRQEYKEKRSNNTRLVTSTPNVCKDRHSSRISTTHSPKFDPNRSFLQLEHTPMDFNYSLATPTNIFGYDCHLFQDDHLLITKNMGEDMTHQACSRLSAVSSDNNDLACKDQTQSRCSSSSGYMSCPSSNNMDVNMGFSYSEARVNINTNTPQDRDVMVYGDSDIDGVPMEAVEAGIVPYTPSIGKDYHEYNVEDVVYSDGEHFTPSRFLAKSPNVEDLVLAAQRSKWDDTPKSNTSSGTSSTKNEAEVTPTSLASDPQDSSTPLSMDCSHQFVYGMRNLHSIRCRNIDDFLTLSWIAEGAFGAVYKAADVETGKVVAIKRVKLGKYLGDGQEEENKLPLAVFREIQYLWSCEHPNIVQMQSIAMGSRSDRVYMVMEYVENDMKTILRDLQQPFTTVEIKSLMSDLLQGVDYLHENNIMHRDLKPSNLLLSRDGILKIADLGLAREDQPDFVAEDELLLTPIVVTLWYRAPEVLLGSKRYGRAVDLWSVGCIMSEFVTRKALFPGRSDIDQVRRIFSLRGTPTEREWPEVGDLPGMKLCYFPKQSKLNIKGMIQNEQNGLSDCGFDLFDRFLAHNPKMRLGAKDALNHEWFHEQPCLESSLNASGSSEERSHTVSWMGNFRVLMEKEVIRL